MSIKPQLMILLGAIVVGVIGIGAAFLLSRPSSEKGTIFGKIEKPDVDSIIRLQSKILSADFKNNDKIPKTGAVYKLNESEISNEKAVEMAAKLGFISRPSGIQTITWAGKNNTLTIDRVRRTLELKFLKVKSLKGNFQVDKLAETAVKFLEKNGFSTDNLAANTTKVRLFQVAGDELEIVEKTTNPVFIEIPFNRKLGNHYLFSPDPTSPAAVVILNSKGQVFRVYYKFADINKTTVGTYPLVDIKKLEPEKIVRFGSLVY